MANPYVTRNEFFSLLLNGLCRSSDHYAEQHEQNPTAYPDMKPIETWIVEIFPDLKTDS